ncbi:hypothetical protein KAR91_61590 [Candidatus Pacearchaeota archaeon]|nr:hypothetical protein [Candidatus Pacearchaeota archaeon]
MKFKEGPTYEDAGKLLRYDPITGIFTWKITIPKGGYGCGREEGRFL